MISKNHLTIFCTKSKKSFELLKRFSKVSFTKFCFWTFVLTALPKKLRSKQIKSSNQSPQKKLKVIIFFSLFPKKLSVCNECIFTTRSKSEKFWSKSEKTDEFQFQKDLFLVVLLDT